MKRFPPSVIVALDVDTAAQAHRFVKALSGRVRIFKVGLQLFTACGPSIVKEIQKRGGKVFLDLKFYDIPNTVAAAVRQAVRLKVSMLTLHAGAGKDMLAAAAEAAKSEARALSVKRPLLLGVTVLTSRKAGAAPVLALAETSLRSGLDGVVCSVREAAAVRRACGRGFLIVTPGIRPRGARAGDQKRIATPAAARDAGADYIVVGRPILEAADPRRALEELLRWK